MYELELERVVDEIGKRGARRVLLQLPDGMRPFAFEIAEHIRKETPSEVIISGDSCYGACDIASRQALELNVDLLIHYGHACFVQSPGVPVLYIEARIPIDVSKMVEAVLPDIAGWESVGLTSTVQHTPQLKEISEALDQRGVKALIGEGTGLTPEDGQVLGCSYAAATKLPEEVDGYIFIGGGRFHAIGLALRTGRPVIIANPYNGKVSRLDESELMQLAKKRMALITAAREAKTIGVLVSSKPGQRALADAMVLAEKLGDREVHAFLIYLDEVRADQLNNFTEPEAFIETACPRIAIDGVAGVNRPILTTTEARVLLGEKTWEQTWGHTYLG
ncbi:TPA: diphthamide biosynthesis enzyme Dph2 [Candidatus Bathyarchaeota archaeon]|nr:diphthamide biosynthesis enzyme Dph2 [Candidatus Bathyarchaeota archaeon]